MANSKYAGLFSHKRRDVFLPKVAENTMNRTWEQRKTLKENWDERDPYIWNQKEMFENPGTRTEKVG